MTQFFKILFLSIALIFCLLLYSSCLQEKGCTDVTALNYNPDAYKDDGSCIYGDTLPNTYSFYRQRHLSVEYSSEIILQLKINDLYNKILSLGAVGAEAIVDDELQDIYATSQDASIQTPIIGYSPLQSSYNELGSGIVLRNKVINTFKADSLITAWIDTIESNAQNPLMIGTPAVYTLSNGLDLAELLHKTLIGSVLYANAMQNINAIANASNTTLTDDQYYTPMENQWDRAFGYVGMPRNWYNYNIAQVANDDLFWQDTNIDGQIDFEQEYLYYLVAEASHRDNTPSANRQFANTLFEALLNGRQAITTKNDTSRLNYKKQLLNTLEELMAANSIHHLNALLAQMELLNTTNENRLLLNKHWAAAFAYLSGLPYYSNNRFTKINTALAHLGNTPLYAVPTSPEYASYLVGVSWIKGQLSLTYNFSIEQIEDW